jgi:CO dehydrogenase maturation factor
VGYRIAVGGKGGVGKTTLAALIVRHLLTRGKTPVLAVDADPNANLAEAIGLKCGTTIGAVLAQFIDEKITIPEGMTKERYLDYKLNTTVVEGTGVDLIAMGRGEGPGCYCYPNLILRGYVETLTSNYPYIVIDNEAGMEHLSRRTSEKVDDMLVVSDPSIRGIRSARRIQELVEELKLGVRRMSLVVMRVPEDMHGTLRREIEQSGLELIGTIPEDARIQEYDLRGFPLTQLPETSPSVTAVAYIMERLLGHTIRG